MYKSSPLFLLFLFMNHWRSIFKLSESFRTPYFFLGMHALDRLCSATTVFSTFVPANDSHRTDIKYGYKTFWTPCTLFPIVSFSDENKAHQMSILSLLGFFFSKSFCSNQPLPVYKTGHENIPRDISKNVNRIFIDFNGAFPFFAP